MKTLFFLFLFATILNSYSKDERSLNPFLTDYCTAYPEGTWIKPDLWKHCCVEHDLYFWAGGSLTDRKESDLRLKSCVEKTGAIHEAQLVYLAVSLGTHSPIRFRTKQWGNAWQVRPRYLGLSEAETGLILSHLETNPHASADLKQSFKEQLYSRLDAQ